MQYIFIVNPKSGNNRGIKIGKVIDDYCKDIFVDYDVIYTTKDIRADKIASRYANKSDIIMYSVGGDGTLNEVVNGIANSSLHLSVIPVGTGNDFYKCLKNFDGEKIDLGKVNDRYFINIASLGLDAEVADLANKLKDKNIKGSYYLSLIKTFFTYKGINLIRDCEEKKITIFTVCNGRFYGGGFEIGREAKLNDGLFDIIEAKAMNKLELINLLIKLSKGTHLTDKNINFYRSSNISIKSEIPLVCNIDGEIITDTKFDFSIKKHAINYSKDPLNICDKLKSKKLIK